MFVERFMNGKETQPLKRKNGKKKMLTGVLNLFYYCNRLFFGRIGPFSEDHTMQTK